MTARRRQTSRGTIRRRSGPSRPEHLLVRDQWQQAQQALQPGVRRAELPPDSPVATLTLHDVLSEDRYRQVLPDDVVAGLSGMRRFNPSATLLEALAGHPGVTAQIMLEIDTALAGQVNSTP